MPKQKPDHAFQNISIRFPEHLYLAIKEMAIEEHRTMTAQITHMLGQHLASTPNAKCRD